MGCRNGGHRCAYRLTCSCWLPVHQREQVHPLWKLAFRLLTSPTAGAPTRAAIQPGKEALVVLINFLLHWHALLLYKHGPPHSHVPRCLRGRAGQVGVGAWKEKGSGVAREKERVGPIADGRRGTGSLGGGLTGTGECRCGSAKRSPLRSPGSIQVQVGTHGPAWPRMAPHGPACKNTEVMRRPWQDAGSETAPALWSSPPPLECWWGWRRRTCSCSTVPVRKEAGVASLGDSQTLRVSAVQGWAQLPKIAGVQRALPQGSQRGQRAFSRRSRDCSLCFLLQGGPTPSPKQATCCREGAIAPHAATLDPGPLQKSTASEASPGPCTPPEGTGRLASMSHASANRLDGATDI